jgi:hypothetical protein
MTFFGDAQVSPAEASTSSSRVSTADANNGFAGNGMPPRHSAIMTGGGRLQRREAAETMAKNGKNERNWKAKCAYLKLN